MQLRGLRTYIRAENPSIWCFNGYEKQGKLSLYLPGAYNGSFARPGSTAGYKKKLPPIAYGTVISFIL
jgi:hypothetical protein